MVKKTSESFLRGGYYGAVQQPRDVIAALYASALSDDLGMQQALEMARQESMTGAQGKALRDNPNAFSAGQIAGNILSTAAPAGAVTKALGAGANLPLIGRALGAVSQGSGALGTVGRGVVEGATAGTITEADPVSGGIGGGIGAGVFGLGAKIARPITDRASDVRKGFVNRLQQAGISDLSPAQITGNRGMELVENVLAKLPFTAGAAREKTEGQLSKFTQEALRSAGIEADRLTPQVREAAEQGFSQRFGDLIEGQTVKIDQPVLNKIASISAEQVEKLPANVKPVVQSYLRDITQSGGEISGKAYQTARSQLSTQARSMQMNDPFTAGVLRDIRNTLDDAAERSLPEEKKGIWNELRRQYGNYKDLQKTVSSTTQDSLEGLVSPLSLLRTLETKNKTKSQAGYGDLYDLARAGRSVLSDNIPDSGTAQRQLVQALLTGGGVAAAGTAGGISPETTAQLALGSVALPKAAQAFINSPAGRAYLTKGIPYAADALQGLTQNSGVVTNALIGQTPAAPQQDFSDIEAILNANRQPQQNQDFSDIEAILRNRR